MSFFLIACSFWRVKLLFMPRQVVYFLVDEMLELTENGGDFVIK